MTTVILHEGADVSKRAESGWRGWRPELITLQINTRVQHPRLLLRCVDKDVSLQLTPGPNKKSSWSNFLSAVTGDNSDGESRTAPVSAYSDAPAMPVKAAKDRLLVTVRYLMQSLQQPYYYN